MTSLSASRLNDYLGCPHQAALWLAGVKAEGPTDATIDLIRKKGFEHEANVLARLKAMYGALAEIPADADYPTREARTKEAIESKVPLIYQAALVHENWQGFPDFLIGRLVGESFLLEPEDAKLARKPKGEHLLQLGLYAELLEKLYGVPVRSGKIHVALGEPVSFDLRRTRYILRRLIKRFEAFVNDAKRLTTPVPCAGCQNCDYQPRCEAEWRTADSPYYVAGVSGAQVQKLAAANINTIDQLANVTPATLVDGIGPETLRKLASQAKLQITARQTGKPAFHLMPIVRGRGFANLPSPDTGDLFFDMEGDPLAGEGLEYLFGIYGQFDSTETLSFKPFWGHDRVQEKIAFERAIRLFVKQMRKHPKAHIYHYAAYEPTALKRLAMRHATMEAELDELLRERRFVDLYRIVVHAMQASTESYSLKDLEALYGRGRSGEVKTAAASIVEYENWCISGEQAILDAIAHYNEEDCISTAYMRNWLESLRPAGGKFNPVGDQAEDRQDKSEERKALELRKQQLAAAMRASKRGDSNTRELIAELLWFHQRAQKPGWWAVFERQDWSDIELIDDAESLGGLECDRNIAPVQVKQSVDTAYKFPPQDTKLKVGDKPRIAETIKNAGTIIDLNAEEGQIVLRRGVRSGEMPERMSLVPAPIDMQGIPDAVLSFAERFTGQPAKEDQAILDIIARGVPRLNGRKSGDALRNPEMDLTQEVVRAIQDLDHSYLFIQGPPGTGKTYTAARAIVALLKDGKRVGVTSNSHKAIGKLLEEIELHAEERGFRFSGAKKGSSDNPESGFDSKNIHTVNKSEEVTAGHQLVGGTVFHFSREDQRSSFDYLFVDEAGQVALGNLVAMGPSASNIVLIGDQMQLPQPVQGVHPGETGLSCLEYLLQDRATVLEDRGILLNITRRLHPKLCAFISDAIYDGRLIADSSTSKRKLVLNGEVHKALKPAGLSFLPVDHDGCTQSSKSEAETIRVLVAVLCAQKVERDGKESSLTLDDILVVAPYNLQVNLLRQTLPAGAKIGTVDKFQGQQAAVVIVSMTTSRGADAPRGTEFLFNPNRFNVAISRAQCLAVVVHGTKLLEGTWIKIEDLRRLNLFAYGEFISQEG
jgi:predicted RecB family nuclease